MCQQNKLVNLLNILFFTFILSLQILDLIIKKYISLFYFETGRSGYLTYFIMNLFDICNNDWSYFKSGQSIVSLVAWLP